MLLALLLTLQFRISRSYCSRQSRETRCNGRYIAIYRKYRTGPSSAPRSILSCTGSVVSRRRCCTTPRTFRQIFLLSGCSSRNRWSLPEWKALLLWYSGRVDGFCSYLRLAYVVQWVWEKHYAVGCGWLKHMFGGSTRKMRLMIVFCIVWNIPDD